MNNISSYIINAFEQHKENIEKSNRKKCSISISTFKETIKNALKKTNDLDGFWVRFPKECANEVKEYLSKEEIHLVKNDQLNDKNVVYFTYDFSDDKKVYVVFSRRDF